MKSPSPHISQRFNETLSILREELSRMAEQVTANVDRAVSGLLRLDLEQCNNVIADDTDVDDAQMRIDRLVMEILLRFQPVAIDLRYVISAIRVAGNLERISDHAVNIAKRARKILAVSPVALPDITEFEELYRLASEELSDSVRSFVDGDSKLGESLQQRDKELDRLHKILVAKLSAKVEAGGEHTENLVHLIFAARSLERIGDLAQNIGEDSAYLENSDDIRHRNRD